MFIFHHHGSAYTLFVFRLVGVNKCQLLKYLTRLKFDNGVELFFNSILWVLVVTTVYGFIYVILLFVLEGNVQVRGVWFFIFLRTMGGIPYSFKAHLVVSIEEKLCFELGKLKCLSYQIHWFHAQLWCMTTTKSTLKCSHIKYNLKTIRWRFLRIKTYKKGVKLNNNNVYK